MDVETQISHGLWHIKGHGHTELGYFKICDIKAQNHDYEVKQSTPSWENCCGISPGLWSRETLSMLSREIWKFYYM